MVSLETKTESLPTAEKQLEVREAKDKAASGDEKKISPFLEFFDSARGM
jgi:hypothetical protein